MAYIKSMPHDSPNAHFKATKKETSVLLPNLDRCVSILFFCRAIRQVVIAADPAVNPVV